MPQPVLPPKPAIIQICERNGFTITSHFRDSSLESFSRGGEPDCLLLQGMIRPKLIGKLVDQVGKAGKDFSARGLGAGFKDLKTGKISFEKQPKGAFFSLKLIPNNKVGAVEIENLRKWLRLNFKLKEAQVRASHRKVPVAPVKKPKQFRHQRR